VFELRTSQLVSMHFQISSKNGVEKELYLGSSKHPEAEFIGGVPLDWAWRLRFVTKRRIHGSPSSRAGWNITTLPQAPTCQTLLKEVSLLYTIYALHLKRKSLSHVNGDGDRQEYVAFKVAFTPTMSLSATGYIQIWR